MSKLKVNPLFYKDFDRYVTREYTKSFGRIEEVTPTVLNVIKTTPLKDRTFELLLSLNHTDIMFSLFSNQKLTAQQQNRLCRYIFSKQGIKFTKLPLDAPGLAEILKPKSKALSRKIEKELKKIMPININDHIYATSKFSVRIYRLYTRLNVINTPSDITTIFKKYPRLASLLAIVEYDKDKEHYESLHEALEYYVMNVLCNTNAFINWTERNAIHKVLGDTDSLTRITKTVCFSDDVIDCVFRAIYDKKDVRLLIDFVQTNYSQMSQSDDCVKNLLGLLVKYITKGANK